jgi:hypothetical protein
MCHCIKKSKLIILLDIKTSARAIKAQHPKWGQQVELKEGLTPLKKQKKMT